MRHKIVSVLIAFFAFIYFYYASRTNTPQYSVNDSQFLTLPFKKNVTKLRVAMLSSMLPQKCGIATFAEDFSTHFLQSNTTDFEFYWIPILSPHNPSFMQSFQNSSYSANKNILSFIRSKIELDYIKTSHLLLTQQFDALIIQHEYGIYHLDSQFLISMLRPLAQFGIKIFLQLHTVTLHYETVHRLWVTKQLVQLATMIVTMSQEACNTLVHSFGKPPEQCNVLLHGVERIQLKNETEKQQIKLQNEFDSNQTICTFGFISGNKGLEYMIHTMSQIKNSFPNATYHIIGQLHPNTPISIWNELQLTSSRLQVLNQTVFFVNQFVPREELVELLQGCDIYVTPYPDKRQISSGTLTLALYLTIPIISTDYIYAKELLSKYETGLIISDLETELTDAVVKLLSNETLYKQIKTNQLKSRYLMEWQNQMTIWKDLLVSQQWNPQKEIVKPSNIYSLFQTQLQHSEHSFFSTLTPYQLSNSTYFVSLYQHHSMTEESFSYYSFFSYSFNSMIIFDETSKHVNAIVYKQLVSLCTFSTISFYFENEEQEQHLCSHFIFKNTSHAQYAIHSKSEKAIALLSIEYTFINEASLQHGITIELLPNCEAIYNIKVNQVLDLRQHVFKQLHLMKQNQQQKTLSSTSIYVFEMNAFHSSTETSQPHWLLFSNEDSLLNHILVEYVQGSPTSIQTTIRNEQYIHSKSIFRIPVLHASQKEHFTIRYLITNYQQDNMTLFLQQYQKSYNNQVMMQQGIISFVLAELQQQQQHQQDQLQKELENLLLTNNNNSSSLDSLLSCYSLYRLYKQFPRKIVYAANLYLLLQSLLVQDISNYSTERMGLDIFMLSVGFDLQLDTIALHQHWHTLLQQALFTLQTNSKYSFQQLLSLHLGLTGANQFGIHTDLQLSQALQWTNQQVEHYLPSSHLSSIHFLILDYTMYHLNMLTFLYS